MKKSGHIRIIGGQWRSRRLGCARVAGLRPSPDAVRETLFNWLPHRLHGQFCLDLFAGSGALGFEAASRGAPNVVLVESHPQALQWLRANRGALQAENQVDIFPGRAERFLRQHGRGQPSRDARRGFDIIFLDPPFAGGMIAPVCETLRGCDLLNPGALVYIESPHAGPALPVPPDWHIIREKRCGAVRSTLLQT